jgi:hypothetical protein
LTKQVTASNHHNGAIRRAPIEKSWADPPTSRRRGVITQHV